MATSQSFTQKPWRTLHPATSQLPRPSMSQHSKHPASPLQRAGSNLRFSTKTTPKYVANRHKKDSRNYFEQLPLPQPSSPESDEFAVSRQYTCMILQQSKKMGGSECQCSADTQIRPRRAENTLVASFCGRWADLANFCSDRWFRYVLLCLFTLPAPLVCSGPRALFSKCSTAQNGPVR